MFFESHAHYDDNRFDADRDELLQTMHNEHGIDYIINSGANIESTLKGIELAEKYDFIYAAAGVHPHDASSLTESNFNLLRECCRHKKVVSIGEIGLDFYYDNSPRDIQRYWFKRQLELSSETGKPVIIHSRDAAQECFDIIKESGVHSGVIHCYSGSVQMAADYVKLGFYIGIGGVITFDKSKKLAEVVESLPLTKILIETDCPYLTPAPNRGKRNDSKNLIYITEKIAQIKGVSMEEAAQITYENACKLYFTNL